MLRLRTVLLLAPALLAACAADPDRRTLAELRSVEPDVSEVRAENSLEQAMAGESLPARSAGAGAAEAPEGTRGPQGPAGGHSA